MVNAADLKSAAAQEAWGFEPPSRHRGIVRESVQGAGAEHPATARRVVLRWSSWTRYRAILAAVADAAAAEGHRDHFDAFVAHARFEEVLAPPSSIELPDTDEIRKDDSVSGRLLSTLVHWLHWRFKRSNRGLFPPDLPSPLSPCSQLQRSLGRS